jgi:hypothetical protein
MIRSGKLLPAFQFQQTTYLKNILSLFGMRPEKYKFSEAAATALL